MGGGLEGLTQMKTAYQASATSACDFVVVRICVHCGHTYRFFRTVTAMAMASGDRRAAASVARRNAEVGAFEKAERVGDRVDQDPRTAAHHGVLCPRCGRFSPQAMQAHFGSGIGEGLARKLRRRATLSAIGGSLAVVLGLAVLSLFLIQDTAVKVAVVFMGLTVLAGAVALFIDVARAARSLRWTSEAGEDELLEMARRACLLARNSLRPPFTTRLIHVIADGPDRGWLLQQCMNCDGKFWVVRDGYAHWPDKCPFCNAGRSALALSEAPSQQSPPPPQAAQNSPTKTATGAGWCSFKCSCGKILRATRASAGKRAKCPACGRGITIPPVVSTGAQTAKQAELRLMDEP